MSLYRNILVAIDGSPDAEMALQHAAALARDQNARLTLLTVAPNPANTAGVGGAAPPNPLDLHAKALREATANVPDDTGVTTLLERGDPAQAILATAEKGGHDLIVMGSHGHGALYDALAAGRIDDEKLFSLLAEVLPPLVDGSQARARIAEHDVIDRRLVFLPDLTHETKAFSRGRPDQALLFAAVVDCLSCGVNPAGQGRLRDDSPTPYGRDEVIFTDHAVAVFNQIDQKIEDLRLDWHRRAMRTQFPALAVEHEIIEQKQHVGPHNKTAAKS